MRKEVFTTGEYYHLYNRGVDKRLIFSGDRDRVRFVNTFYLLNNFQAIPANFNVVKMAPMDILVSREPMVAIVAGALMPNHYHIVATPLSDDHNISKLFHKVGVSYTMYFNKRSERSGALFESTFKAKHIDRGEYATYLTKYIHLNARSLFQTKSGIELINALVAYPWSTLGDYVGGKSNLTHLVNVDFRDNTLGMNADEYRRYCFDALNEDEAMDAEDPRLSLG